MREALCTWELQSLLQREAKCDRKKDEESESVPRETEKKNDKTAYT